MPSKSWSRHIYETVHILRHKKGGPHRHRFFLMLAPLPLRQVNPIKQSAQVHGVAKDIIGSAEAQAFLFRLLIVIDEHFQKGQLHP